MAHHATRGWVWASDERLWIGTWQRKVSAQRRRIAEQLHRFQAALPDLAVEAAALVRPLLEECDRLLMLDGRHHGRKYQAMSPEEARLVLQHVGRLLDEWQRFTGRPDVMTRIREANTRSRAAGRKFRDAVRNLGERVETEMVRPEFRARYTALAAEIETVMGFLAKDIRRRQCYGTEVDEPILTRYAMVQFLRASTMLDRNRRGGLEAWVRSHPEATFREIVMEVVASVQVDEVRSWLTLAARVPAVASTIPAGTELGFLAAGAHRGVDETVRGWKTLGLNASVLAREDFSFLTLDCSLEARPA